MINIPAWFRKPTNYPNLQNKQQKGQGEEHCVFVFLMALLQTTPLWNGVWREADQTHFRKSAEVGLVCETREAMAVVVQKHWRATQERVEKFLSDIYFTDANLRGR